MNKTAKTLAARACFLSAATLACVLCAGANAQPLSGEALVDELRSGGYVLVMRHANASREAPGPRQTSPGNTDGERELTDEGIAMITGMRHAFRELDIPVGVVLSSPTFRTRQHVRHFGFGELEVVDELGTDTMRDDAARSAWLRGRAGEGPRAGTNTIIVTHAPNIIGAFEVAEIADGETLIVRPGNGAPEVVARLPIEEWARLAVT
jgi:phosphohistidine phosphatase SixA